MNFHLPKSKQPIPSHAKKVFEGIMFTVWQWEQDLFDGTKATFEKVERVPTAMVIPVTSEGKIVFTRQTQPLMGTYYSALGGKVDRGEDIVMAAKRELLEEAGMEASSWQLLYATQASSYIEWINCGFVARDAQVVKEPTADAGEKIELLYLNFEEFLQIALHPECIETEIKKMVLEALAFPEKKQALKKLFFND